RLVGQDPTSAGAQLGSLQLTANEQTEYSATIPVGQVTRTDPPAGASVPVGSSVTVFVSNGPQPANVPDLTRMPQAQAQGALSHVGLALGTITEVSVTDKSQNGKVQSQTPAPNTQAAAGSTVNIVVGSYQANTTTSTSSTTTGGGGGPGIT